MGIEFIRSASGKPYVKRWSKGLNRTKIPSLVDVRLTEESRTFTAALTAGGTPEVGAEVLVQTVGNGDLVVLNGLKPVARIANPPPSVLATLSAQHGMAKAVVQRIGGFGRTAEVKFT